MFKESAFVWAWAYLIEFIKGLLVSVIILISKIPL